MSIYAQLVAIGDWRRRELSQLKTMLPAEDALTFECLCRGTLVLCYSHWEGYFNDITEAIFGQVDADRLSKVDLGAAFRCLFLRPDMDRLASSGSTYDGVIQFLKAYEASQSGVEFLNPEVAKSRSVLNWKRLCVVAEIYGLSWSSFEKKRIFIDHKLCRIRHQIAHGDSPRLTRRLAIEVIDETLMLLDDLVDYFSEVEKRIVDLVGNAP